jgi:Asp-tRNA(Asn)/Glu-tRNA(Gln) amidotransferase A subunit family amidase
MPMLLANSMPLPSRRGEVGRLGGVGPLARNATDCAAVLEVIAGHHPSDPDCVDTPFAVERPAPDLTGMRVGVVTENQLAPAGARHDQRAVKAGQPHSRQRAEQREY